MQPGGSGATMSTFSTLTLLAGVTAGIASVAMACTEPAATLKGGGGDQDEQPSTDSGPTKKRDLQRDLPVDAGSLTNQILPTADAGDGGPARAAEDEC